MSRSTEVKRIQSKLLFHAFKAAELNHKIQTDESADVDELDFEITEHLDKVDKLSEELFQVAEDADEASDVEG